MPTNIGHFEILSELSKSSTGTVYKANDSQSGQTVALKVVQMSAFGEHAGALEQALVQEAESVKRLSSPNLTTVESASVIDGQFCAAMEYVQGNSIATMLARKEGFSIWDLLDIGRQLSSGLDYAAAQQITHQSLEPSKIMCGWDGTVKILSFGVSGVGNFVQYAGPGVSSILHYMSPEQVRGEAMDGRSHMFSLGAMLYEMVTERKAFDREDIESLRQSILESTPVAPVHVNAKVHPLLSDLIMKALAKDPAQRYQNGRELLNDLERCKETKPAAKKAEAKATIASPAAKAVAQAKFVGGTGAPAAPSSKLVSSNAAATQSVPQWPAAQASHPSKIVPPKAAAAAAGIGSNSSPVLHPEISDVGDTEVPAAQMSAAVADEAHVDTFEPQSAPGPEAPKIAVDPLMAEGPATGGGGTSFSEISELPPLKEVYVAPPPPPPVDPEPIKPVLATAYRGAAKPAEKPKVQPKQVATKAIKEIKGVPPKLMFYSMVGAAALILAIAARVVIYIHTQNNDDDSGAKRAAAAPTQIAQTPAQPADAQPVPAAQDSASPSSTAEQAQPQEIAEPQATQVQPVAPVRARNAHKKAAAPAIIPGQLTIDSVPQGAQVQIDGTGDPSWVTPFTLANLQPGQHSISVSKTGYTTDKRAVTVVAASRASAVVHLEQLMAALVVKSDPVGASVYIDGHDSGAKTPAQVSVNKGQHVILVRMSGYLDETMTGQFVLGQSLSFSPTLRALGNVDNMRTVGKMSKLFHKGGQEGQGTISIHTQPKGADIAINRHMVEKTSPADVMLDPGNYAIDITMSGYVPVHKIVTVTSEKGAKVVVDEVLQPQQ